MSKAKKLPSVFEQVKLANDLLSQANEARTFRDSKGKKFAKAVLATDAASRPAVIIDLIEGHAASLQLETVKRLYMWLQALNDEVTK